MIKLLYKPFSLMFSVLGGLVAGIAVLIGRARLKQATPPVPGETIGSVKADVEELKERAHR